MCKAEKIYVPKSKVERAEVECENCVLGDSKVTSSSIALLNSSQGERIRIGNQGNFSNGEKEAEQLQKWCNYTFANSAGEKRD